MKEKIKKQKELLINWKKELKNKISQNHKKEEKIELLFIEREWLNDWERTFSDNSRSENETFSELKNFKKLENDLCFINSDLEIDPEKDFFMIKEDIWNNFEKMNLKLNSKITTDCIFCNKKLMVDLGRDDYFYYINSNNDITEGYIHFNDSYKNEKILKEFREEEVENFIKEMKLKKEETNERKIFICKSFQLIIKKKKPEVKPKIKNETIEDIESKDNEIAIKNSIIDELYKKLNKVSKDKNYEMNLKINEISNLNFIIKELQKQINIISNENNSKYEQKVKEVEEKNNEIKQKKEIINELVKKLKKIEEIKKEEIKTKNEQIKLKEEALIEMKRKLEENKEKNNKEIYQKNDEIKKKDEKIKELEKIINIKTDIKTEDKESFQEQIKLYKELIKDKEIIIENLKQEIEKYKIQINNNSLSYQSGQILNPCVLHFISMDQKINSSFLCDKNEPFVRVEEKLYQKYPDYKETDNFFLVNGMKVYRFKTIGENKITEEGEKIILYTPNDNSK